jgi:hypothetical protein
MANMTIDKKKAMTLKTKIQSTVNAIFFFIRVVMPNARTERSGGKRRSDYLKNVKEPSA